MWAVSVGFIQHLLGCWIWAMLVRRPLLSVFSVIFRILKNKLPNEFVVLPPVVVNELELAVCLSAQCYARSREMGTTVGTFDASNYGDGLAYRADCPEHVLLELSARVEMHGCWSAFSTTLSGGPALVRMRGRRAVGCAQDAADWLRCDWGKEQDRTSGWKAVVLGRWDKDTGPRHITVAECRAGYRLVRWFASQSQHRGKRLVCIGDNQPSLGMLAKGRSSVYDMNRVARNVCAIAVSADVSLAWVWVRSGSNPADGPSRFRKWECSSHGGWIRDLTEEGIHPHPGPQSKKVSVWAGPLLKAPKKWGPGDATGHMGLRWMSVQPETACKYMRAWFGFYRWYCVFMRGCDGSLDEALSEYIYWCWDSGEVKRGQINCLFCGILLVEPSLRDSIAGAKRTAKGWSKLQKAKSWLPDPRQILRACVWELIIVGELSVACALLLGFDCYLRHSEIRLLRVSDIALDGDVRSVGGPALTLRFTKSGRPQHVAIRCRIALCLLPRIMRGRRGDASLFGLKNDRLLSVFKRVQCSLGLDRHLFVVHSLRHGGATHDHVNKVLEMNDSMLRGRWSGLTVTRRYIQDAQALLLMKNLPERVVLNVKANVANMARMFG